MATYTGPEADARVLRCYEPTFVHRLLRTEKYARAVIAGPAAQRAFRSGPRGRPWRSA
ncbi:Scr1 family TA system antitoxin-like transcriptional regulator [Streptomyces sp. NPDC092369]|uniref:Scr1 family TA system antitoxin-like transcriptional regulator n=1 Tax=Streptomyces sp. NPDC092369 TaxID=3366015 RepID=UPI0038031144